MPAAPRATCTRSASCSWALAFPELVRTQRRAEHLAQLETEKWKIPQAGALPRWETLPLERCTVLKAAQQSIAGQISVLEGYAADSSPMADLAALAQRKVDQQRQRDQKLVDLQQLLAGGQTDKGQDPEGHRKLADRGRGHVRPNQQHREGAQGVQAQGADRHPDDSFREQRLAAGP